MRNLEYYFNCMDTSCREIGLHGLPSDYSFNKQSADLSEARLLEDFFGTDRSKQWTPVQLVINQINCFTPDQRSAFNHIAEAILGRGENRCFFVEGAGGCGKTYLYNSLIRWCLAGKPLMDAKESLKLRQTLNSGSVLAAASTGIAALLLIGGGTVHRMFSVPNEVEDETVPRIPFESAGAKSLRAVELIIIDEISMLSKKVFRYVDRLLRDVCAIDKPFGGKAIVLGGDWRQLTPVVEHGTREDQVHESIKMDNIFRESFKQLSLTQNMRVISGQTAFRAWLSEIGNGLSQAGADNRPSQLNIPKEMVEHNLEAIISFCFTNDMFSDPN